MDDAARNMTATAEQPQTQQEPAKKRGRGRPRKPEHETARGRRKARAAAKRELATLKDTRLDFLRPEEIGHEGAAEKELQLDARRERVGLLRLQGLSVREIAERVKVHPSTVHDDIRFLHELFKKRCTGPWMDILADEIAQVEAARKKAWASVEASEKKSGGVADVRFLYFILDAGKRLTQLMGADAPARLLNMEGKDAGNADDQRRVAIAETLSVLFGFIDSRRRAAGNAGAGPVDAEPAGIILDSAGPGGSVHRDGDGEGPGTFGELAAIRDAAMGPHR